MNREKWPKRSHYAFNEFFTGHRRYKLRVLNLHLEICSKI